MTKVYIHLLDRAGMIDFLLVVGAADSRNNARRLCSQRAVRIYRGNGMLYATALQPVLEGDVVKVGKHRVYEVLPCRDCSLLGRKLGNTNE